MYTLDIATFMFVIETGFTCILYRAFQSQFRYHEYIYHSFQYLHMTYQLVCFCEKIASVFITLCVCCAACVCACVCLCVRALAFNLLGSGFLRSIDSHPDHIRVQQLVRFRLEFTSLFPCTNKIKSNKCVYIYSHITHRSLAVLVVILD